jgi:hypothetical protein
MALAAAVKRGCAKLAFALALTGIGVALAPAAGSTGIHLAPTLAPALAPLTHLRTGATALAEAVLKMDRSLQARRPPAGLQRRQSAGTSGAALAFSRIGIITK